MATYNPWQVESIQAFYYLKCPECEFDTIEENMFEYHAIENHPMSYELFGKKSVKAEEFDSVMIKEEQISDVDEQDNNCAKFDFHHTESEMVDENDLSDSKVKEESLEEQFESKDLQNIASDNDGIDQVKKGFTDEDFESEDHIASVHEEKKPWYCFQCERGFISNSILKLHFESEHEGKNLYMCPKCNSDFSQKVNLKRHMETVHEVKKILKCTTCSYECHQKIDMEKHMKTHYKNEFVKHSMPIREKFDVNIPSTSEIKVQSNFDKTEINNLNDQNKIEFSRKAFNKLADKSKVLAYGLNPSSDARRPLMTCPQLIAEALMKASESMLVLSDIYRAINYRHPYYELDNPTWQNRIRHQLSINDSFVKAEKTVTGRGCYWKLSDNLQGGVAKYLKKINPQQFDPQWSEPVTKKMKLEGTKIRTVLHNF